MKKMISVIVPCYNEQESLPAFYEAICSVASSMSKTNFEFLFVNDGSKDNTLAILRSLSKQDIRVRYLSFSRNFGKEAGIFAGLTACKGDYIVLCDADLQHPPEMIADMYYAITEEGYDSVAAQRKSRKGEPILRSCFSKIFYATIRKLSKADIVDGATDFRMMTRQMTEAVLSMCEYNRFTKGIFGWVGFDTKWIAYENRERMMGKTKWSFGNLFRYSIEGLVAFSTAPLAISSVTGFLSCAISILWILIIIVKTLVWGEPVAGFPTLACLILFIGGIQLFSIGILGQYLSKTYLETKKRPIYIVKETEETLQKSISTKEESIHK